MNRKQISEILGVSEKSVSRYVASGRLPDRRIGGALDIPDADVERLKAELEAPTERAAQSPQNGAETALARLAEVSAMQGFGGALVPVPRGQMQAPIHASPLVPVADKMLLSLEEAGAMSNVSVARLRVAIKSSQLPARRIGRGYRVRPDDLRRWVDGFFEEMNR